MRRKPFIQPKNKLYLTIQLHYYNTSMLSYFIKSFQNVVALASLICFLGCATPVQRSSPVVKEPSPTPLKSRFT